jgi:hypothetical protein
MTQFLYEYVPAAWLPFLQLWVARSHSPRHIVLHNWFSLVLLIVGARRS